MLDYIIKMPPDGCSHDRGHKYPFSVSELFACEVSQINDLFFTAPPSIRAVKKLEDEPSKDQEESKEENQPSSPYDTVKVGSSDSSSSSEDSDDDIDRAAASQDKPLSTEDL